MVENPLLHLVENLASAQHIYFQPFLLAETLGWNHHNPNRVQTYSDRSPEINNIIEKNIYFMSQKTNNSIIMINILFCHLENLTEVRSVCWSISRIPEFPTRSRICPADQPLAFGSPPIWIILSKFKKDNFYEHYNIGSPIP